MIARKEWERWLSFNNFVNLSVRRNFRGRNDGTFLPSLMFAVSFPRLSRRNQRTSEVPSKGRRSDEMIEQPRKLANKTRNASLRG
ncbi:MAG: hypothetical protein ACTS4V_00835 [Candidatus Hodgkinia cicadicola]